MSDMESLPQDVGRSKINEPQRSEDWNVLMEEDHSKKTPAEILKQNRTANSDECISDTDIPNIDFYKNLTKQNLLDEAQTRARARAPKPAAKTNRSAASKQPIKKKEGHKVGILDYNYPNVLLNREQLILVKEAVLKNVQKQANKTLKPRFLNSDFKLGWLLVTCADEDTVEWLKELYLKPWADANLMITAEEYMPDAQIELTGKFPNSSETTEEILGFLKAQNAGLNTADWRVYRRKDYQKTTLLTFVADNNSMQQLKKYDFKLSYKFGVINIRPRKIFNPPRFERQGNNKRFIKY